jgi:hypothetical protein
MQQRRVRLLKENPSDPLHLVLQLQQVQGVPIALGLHALQLLLRLALAGLGQRLRLLHACGAGRGLDCRPTLIHSQEESLG